MSETPKKCETCRYWDNSTSLATNPDETGACRISPPVADDRSGQARWPYTTADDWCAHWIEGATF